MANNILKKIIYRIFVVVVVGCYLNSDFFLPLATV